LDLHGELAEEKTPTNLNPVKKADFRCAHEGRMGPGNVMKRGKPPEGPCSDDTRKSVLETSMTFAEKDRGWQGTEKGSHTKFSTGRK